MTLKDCSLFVAIIMAAVHASQALQFQFQDNEYQYLPGRQGVLSFKLSYPVTIDGKSYNDIWIYRNGFVTLGTALEEEAYPIITEGAKIRYVPFENLKGENIIAVFITHNLDISDSVVRVRESCLNNMTDFNKGILRQFEYLTIASYGEGVVRPTECVLVIEWKNMMAAGTTNNKNSFRLYVLSNKDQSLAIFDYWNIESTSYKLFSGSLSFQSGIRSYGNKIFVLPHYNMSIKDIPLKRSSNIAIRNTWLINLGDSTNHTYIGLPRNVAQNKITTSMKTGYDKFTPSSTQTRTIFETSEKITSPGDSHYKTRSSTADSTLPQSRPQSSTFSTTPGSTQHASTSTNERSKLPKSKPEVRSFSLAPGNINDEYTKYPSSTVILNPSTQAHQPHKITKYITPKDTEPNKSDRTISKYNATPRSNISLDEYIQVKYLDAQNGGWRTTDSYSTNCNLNSCAVNEECFMSNGSSCCQCAMNTVHLGSQCVDRGHSPKMRSFGTVSLPLEGSFVTFDMSLSTTVRQKLLSVHLTLQTNRNIDLYLRNFLLLLYPLFHIPMTFYASPWMNQNVPNLSGLINGKAGINIYISIDGYGDLSVTFKMIRDKEDQWTITINSLDITRVRALRLDGLKLEEKTMNPQYLRYVLTQKSSVDFIGNSLSYTDEAKNRTIIVNWRGSMTFTQNCLSDFIESRNYFVKFADAGYCNTDCIGNEDKNCRMMCLSYPTVFDSIPGACEGNQCPNNLICVEDKDRYDCKCPIGMIQSRDSCVIPMHPSPAQSTTRKKKKGIFCSQCSQFSSCKILNSERCCLCRTGYVGTGITCFPQDGLFEIKGFGKLNVLRNKRESMTPIDFRILFRQWHSESSINYATLVDTGILAYSTSKEQELVHLILMLSPIFDIPMSLFARYITGNLMSSIYATSKGSIKLTVNVEGLSPSPMSIVFTVSESNNTLSINVKVQKYASAIRPLLMDQAQRIFEKRIIPDIKYRIFKRQLTLLPYEIQVDDNLRSAVVRISGSGRIDACSGEDEDERMFVISTHQPTYCKTRCTDSNCEPFCQAIPILHVKSKEIECNPSCHKKAKCTDSVCICQYGYSGDGLFCQPIRKTLECNSDTDCNNRPHFECRNMTCSCKTGTVMKDNECVLVDECQNCKANERCEKGRCICSYQYQRNRITQLCAFDCSICDIYSTTCSSDMCKCKDKFVVESGSNTTCTWRCQSDGDCPSNEICGPQAKCICPSIRIGGLCQSISDCSSCHKNAVCLNGVCHCHPEWIGDGITCKFNCSLCFHPLFCDPMSGCSCPPGHVGDGRQCIENKCPRCPVNSKCERNGNGFYCQCRPGMFMKDKECIQDVVQIDIIPPGPIIFKEGDQMDLICLAVSRANNLRLSWSRKTGKEISGTYLFFDDPNKTLKLSMPQIRKSDADEYVCQTSTGEYKSAMVFVDGPNECPNQCHAFASCVSGKCQCSDNYVGDGLICVAASKCSSTCARHMICDESRGKCICATGYREDKSICIPDCTQQNNCDSNAICNRTSGLCQCVKGFFGNGTKCWKERIDCLLTKKCGTNANCVRVNDVHQHICVCNDRFIGDGDSCYERMNCDLRPCGSNSFCEPTIVKDHFGDLHTNGKCSCEPGYQIINGKCKDLRITDKTFWLTMGEAIISLGANTNLSKIRFIDTSTGDNVQNGGILVLNGDCLRRKLYWSGQNGINIRSMSLDDVSKSTILLSGQGKVIGISVDDMTGNVFFTDSNSGKIAIIDPQRNISQTLIQLNDYHPGQIVAHSTSGRLFWTVGDFLNPRIETSLMTGEDRQIFVLLKNRPISLSIVKSKANGDDSLCWVEVNNHVKKESTLTTKSPTYGFIKCANINAQSSLTVILSHTIIFEEPSSAFVYSDHFYWGVRKGKYIRTTDASVSKIGIIPNCCDEAIRGLFIMERVCRQDINPCADSIRNGCRHICVPTMSKDGKIGSACLNGEKS